MSTSDLVKFPAGSQDKGLSTFEPDISQDISWDENTVNVSGGLRRGVSVRYGMAPLAMHSNTAANVSTGTNGLMKSEGATGAGLINRDLIYGIVPVTFAPYDGAYPKNLLQFYVYLVGLHDGSSAKTLDACIGAILSSSVNKQENSFISGLAESSYREESPLVRRDKTELLNLPQTGTPTAANMQSILRQIASRYWTPYAHISVSGKRVPYQWMLGTLRSTPDATHSPAVNIWSAASAAGSAPTVYCGAPSEIITREATSNNSRLYKVYCLDLNLYPLDMTYFASITNSDTAAATAYDESVSMYAAKTATKGGASVAYGSAQYGLVNDPGSFTNTRHEAILVAGEIPLAIIYQDWLTAVKGMMPRWVDLSNPGCVPRLLSLSQGDFLSGDQTTSAFAPSGSAGQTTTPTNPEPANSGFLRKDSTYDFGFSYYNKLLDYETNVAFAIQRTILTNDFQCLTPNGMAIGYNLYKWMVDQTGNNNPWEYSPTAAYSGGEIGRGLSLNDYEVRFYYREIGATEWLPAGRYDAAQLWFFSAWPVATGSNGPEICANPIAGLPGGQPNGFVDYSPLPKQTYICTTVFQNRAFWWSEKSMHFSYTNNIYVYPTRNIVASPTGKWRGGIVHVRTNLAQQVSRLVVFGDSAYVARFTGDKTLQNVRISTTTVGQFEIDGSDFRMDYLCDATAFSFRSACVADGILYWWGPQGVIKDDGVNTPIKISWDLEPDIFSWVDMSRTSEIHCVYNKRSREVIWFYPPRTADSTYPTYGLAYNVDNENFYPYKFSCQVDSSQNIKIENDTTPANMTGERILLHCRDAASSTSGQRTFYFDEVNKAGDMYPRAEFMISTITTPSTGTRRLTLASGSQTISGGSIAVNDLLSFQNVKGYAPGIGTATDMIAKITAVNNGAGTMDILLPTGGDISNFTGAPSTYFPVYHKTPTAQGLGGITYQMATNYWIPTGAQTSLQNFIPNGMSESWYFQYLYFLFHYIGIPTPTNIYTGQPTGAQISLGYRTPAGGGFITDTLSLVNNSDGNCQIHHPMRNGEQAASGQAIKYRLSGIHIGDPWTLEYLEAHCKRIGGFTLKQFEG